MEFAHIYTISGVSLNNRHNFNIHIIGVHSENAVPTFCQYCGGQYKINSVLRGHIRVELINILPVWTALPNSVPNAV